jgi:NDP-4-keto-2,6-dideoxyhexose 3-C-methyltransferase
MTLSADLCTKIERCRICGSDELVDVVDMGAQYVASLFPTGPLPAELDQPFPLHVIRCAAPGGCGLVQLEHAVSPRVLYDHYGYRSGTNEMMRANLAGIAHQTESIVSLRPGDVVLDIGCNDGTLLESYATPGIDRVGIDPSDAIKAIENPDITAVNDFFNKDTFEKVRPGKKARAVTSIAMFYDLSDPAAFVRDVGAVLDDDGIWVLELSYLPAMLEANAFDTICHEHLEYYSLGAIEWLFRSEGFELLRVDVNDVNGGSFRLVVSREGSRPRNAGALAGIERLRRAEEALGLATDAPYERFREACAGVKSELTRLILAIKDQGKRVYVYGASTKGNTLLQFCGLDGRMIDKAADRNPDKWGTKTVGTGIPIISEDEARADAPEYFLALPWHFEKGFIKREQEYLARGGHFIFPLPEVRVIGASA